jgi:ABC-type sugar transport system permease subunit
MKNVLEKVVAGLKWVIDKYFMICEKVIYGVEIALQFLYSNVFLMIVKGIAFLFKYPPLSYLLKALKWVQGDVKKFYRNLSMEKKKALVGYAFISPFIIGFLGLVLYPVGRIIYMSFNNVVQFQTTFTYTWIGLDNFTRILREDIDFVLQVQDFIVRVILFTPVIITLAIIVAMLLNQDIKGKGFFRMVFFLPIIILNGELLANMSEYGGMDIQLSFFVLDIINTIVPRFAVDLFIELFAIIVEILWYTGVPILIFLAMLQKVDKSLYEAASIDGANAWSSFWKITLPIISPAITISIIFIVVFLGNFDGNPINDNIINSLNDQARRDGYASAMALIYTFVQIMVITILLFVSNRQIRDVVLGRNRRKKKLLAEKTKLVISRKEA